MEERVTVAEAAIELGITRHSVWRHIKAKRLKAEKPGRDLLIRRSELEHFKQARPRPGWPRGKPRKPAESE